MVVRIHAAAMTTLVAGVCAIASAPAAQADDPVVYEVTSSLVSAADVEYSDIGGHNIQPQVSLPWRIATTVATARSNDTIVNAKWAKEKSQWLTVRIYSKGSLLCEKTRDTGDLTCYGNTDHR